MELTATQHFEATHADWVAATAAGAAGAVAMGDQGDVAEREKPSETLAMALYSSRLGRSLLRATPP